MTIAYIGLGSNMKSPKQQIESALKLIEEMATIQVLQVSSLYKSKPIGPQDQDDYINAVAKIGTDLMPHELFGRFSSKSDFIRYFKEQLQLYLPPEYM